MLGGDEATLQIAGHAVGLVGLLHRDRRSLTRRVLHPPRGVNVVEEKIAAFSPPHGAFGGTDIAAVAGSELADHLAGADDAIELGRHRLDLLRRLGPDDAHVRYGKTADRAGHSEKVTT
jgi:hypothetical protein